MLQSLVKDGGLFLHGALEEFEYTPTGLRPQGGNRLYTRVGNAGRWRKDSKSKKELPAHPEGGYPPTSRFKHRQTVWKWTTELPEAPKKWIEYDRETGMIIEDDDFYSDDSDASDEPESSDESGDSDDSNY